jgi:hypothetical protein
MEESLCMNYLFYFCLIFFLIYWLEVSPRFFPNVLIIRKSPAEELETWLKKFNWSNRQELSDPGSLPRYKFYSEVVEVLLQLARKMGGNYQESLLFLREGLQVDRQFEKKIKEATLGMWLQMGLMMTITWTFIFGALSLVEVKVSTLHLVMIFLWQGTGLSFLPFLLTYFRKRYFGDIGKIWKMLFVLNSLVKVPLSRTEVLTMAGVLELNNIKQKSLETIVTKLKETCQRTLKQGSSYEGDVKYLMEELRFQEKWHFELFEKRLTVIKLALLSIFFLPSYLAFIFLLLGDLMTMM